MYLWINPSHQKTHCRMTATSNTSNHQTGLVCLLDSCRTKALCYCTPFLAVGGHFQRMLRKSFGMQTACCGKFWGPMVCIVFASWPYRSKKNLPARSLGCCHSSNDSKTYHKQSAYNDAAKFIRENQLELIPYNRIS